MLSVFKTYLFSLNIVKKIVFPREIVLPIVRPTPTTTPKTNTTSTITTTPNISQQPPHLQKTANQTSPQPVQTGANASTVSSPHVTRGDFATTPMSGVAPLIQQQIDYYNNAIAQQLDYLSHLPPHDEYKRANANALILNLRQELARLSTSGYSYPVNPYYSYYPMSSPYNPSMAIPHPSMYVSTPMSGPNNSMSGQPNIISQSSMTNPPSLTGAQQSSMSGQPVVSQSMPGQPTIVGQSSMPGAHPSIQPPMPGTHSSIAVQPPMPSQPLMNGMYPMSPSTAQPLTGMASYYPYSFLPQQQQQHLQSHLQASSLHDQYSER